MAKIEWDDSLSVGVGLIDEQHKMLIQKLRDLSDALDEGREFNKIMKTLDFMIDYTDFHFSTEEKHMAEHDYPELEDQKNQHEHFKVTLNHILEDFKEEGPTKALATSINVFLLNWLINHIKGTDLKLGKFFAEKGLTDIQ
ncbi:MAG: hemerythrin family protein [Candidatus Aminicenantes bacterium]|nr:MAG: hemerythrin family protein [Candidatus Aminicenantes bacterium]